MDDEARASSEAAAAAATPQAIAAATRRLDLALGELHVALARRLGVSQSELAAITHVSAAGELGPTELARRLDVTTGAVTALVDRLTERGHLVASPSPATGGDYSFTSRRTPWTRCCGTCGRCRPTSPPSPLPSATTSGGP